jgi:hypothetical protein
MTDGTVIISAENQTIGIRFGMQAIMSISADGVLDSANAKGQSEQAFVSVSIVVQMAYHGYLNWCLYEDAKPMSKKQFLDCLDDAFVDNPKIYEDIVKAFEGSKSLKKLQESQKKLPTKPKAKK